MRRCNTSVAQFFAVLAIGVILSPGAFAQAMPRSEAKLGTPAMSIAQAQPQPNPGNLFNLATSSGQTFRFLVLGTVQGRVWGDGVYTTDSDLATAAVHAGLLAAGESGIVTVETIEGLPRYQGTTSNGVTSLSYGPWALAYRLTGVEQVTGDTLLPDPGNLTDFRGQSGTVLTFEVVGSAFGGLWGDGIYSDDSTLAAAAVHAGVLEVDQTGPVTVEILDGQDSYGGVTRNGVTSMPYGAWQGSFRIVPAAGGKTKLSN